MGPPAGLRRQCRPQAAAVTGSDAAPRSQAAVLQRPSEDDTGEASVANDARPAGRAAAGAQQQVASTSTTEAAARQASQASTSGRGTLKQEAQRDREKVADKLIAVFADKTPAEWRKLIAHSKQWPTLADSVFQRLEARMAAEMEAAEKSRLRRLLRRLRDVHEELQEYSDTLQDFREVGSHEWESMVASSRPVFTAEFFAHMENLVRAAHADPAEQQELASTAAKLLALVHAHDEVSGSAESMQAAALQFESLLQVSSLEEADGKIDALAKSGALDPALLLTMAKAYAAAKETDKTKEEVKDIMAHLYFKAKESFARMQPPEVRILKHLLSLDDPRQRSAELAEAFKPGPEIATDQHDYLSTTPERLAGAAGAIVAAYERSAGSASMLGQAGSLMSPAVIARLRELLGLIRSDFM